MALLLYILLTRLKYQNLQRAITRFFFFFFFQILEVIRSPTYHSLSGCQVSRLTCRNFQRAITQEKKQKKKHNYPRYPSMHPPSPPTSQNYLSTRLALKYHSERKNHLYLTHTEFVMYFKTLLLRFCLFFFFVCFFVFWRIFLFSICVFIINARKYFNWQSSNLGMHIGLDSHLFDRGFNIF